MLLFTRIYKRNWNLIEFSLNVFTKFSEFNDKNICHYSKRAQTCHQATSCVGDQDATTVPVRHMWETWSLNGLWFMLQWLIRFLEFAKFNEFLFHLGKTPIEPLLDMIHIYILRVYILLPIMISLILINSLKCDKIQKPYGYQTYYLTINTL